MSTTSEPAVPAPTRRRNAEATRAALLAAAKFRFAHHGYEATTLRQVAADADVNPALVIRYFGSKDQLFAEATATRPDILDMIDGPMAQLGERIVRATATKLHASNSSRMLIGLMQSQASEQSVARLHTLVIDQFALPLAERLTGPRARLRATLIGAQILGLIMLTEIVDPDGEHRLTPDDVVAVYAPAIQRLVDPPE